MICLFGSKICYFLAKIFLGGCYHMLFIVLFFCENMLFIVEPSCSMLNYYIWCSNVSFCAIYLFILKYIVKCLNMSFGVENMKM